MRETKVLDEVEDEIEYLSEYNIKQYLFVILMALASVILLLGCFGMTFKWMRNLCCTMLYGTVLLPIWVVTLGFGIAAIYISYTAADEFEKTCDTLI